jgi:hypothetical protein
VTEKGKGKEKGEERRAVRWREDRLGKRERKKIVTMDR